MEKNTDTRAASWHLAAFLQKFTQIQLSALFFCGTPSGLHHPNQDRSHLFLVGEKCPAVHTLSYLFVNDLRWLNKILKYKWKFLKCYLGFLIEWIAELLYLIINMDMHLGRMVVSNSSILNFKEFKLRECRVGTYTRLHPIVKNHLPSTPSPHL